MSIPSGDGSLTKSVQEKTHAVEDVVEITHSAPYKSINFLGTYLACALGAVASYGGYVMPATSLSLINEDIGMFFASLSCFLRLYFIGSQRFSIMMGVHSFKATYDII